ncbi:hypothetical protein ATSB10_07510 [Dyella thiooxydans]|uniref:Aminomethyltransferase folate-binding domain-containing protein n=1 Tax=Dyella thiooxydans TaxID=445710 RepID=A0A161JCV9_9GAMM|nr:folate-binding protein YgfZ [Dyella thiooxydans]AND68205.1 hypothetical protein ATSB10_07510 [Dyella thiooxydans]
MSPTAPTLPAETLVIEGPDAAQFMHGQFTSPVLALSVGSWQFSAWLDATGRVRALFHLARLADQRWVLLLRGGQAGDLKNELSRFVFRARVELLVQPVGLLTAGPAMALHATEEAEGILHVGCGDHSIVIAAEAPGDDLRAMQIREGWPWLPAGAIGQYNAASLGLHHLGAVALDKGCYPGQEIVARLHYRGGNKRRLCRVMLSQAVAPDTRLKRVGDGAELHLLDAVGGDSGVTGLAVAHEDWLIASQDSHDALLTCGARARIVESWGE